jgi:hypothetical protein
MPLSVSKILFKKLAMLLSFFELFLAHGIADSGSEQLDDEGVKKFRPVFKRLPGS